MRDTQGNAITITNHGLNTSSPLQETATNNI